MGIGELVEKSGISRSMIHYYIKKKVLHPPIKTSPTMAYYDDNHLNRLMDILSLKKDMRISTKLLLKKLEDVDNNKEHTEQQRSDMLQESTFQLPKTTRKQQITEAGIKVFAKKGYHKTRVKDISDSIEISPGTFYLYFKNKQDLFTNVANNVVRALVGEEATAIKDEKDYMKKLYLRGKVFFNNYTKYFEILSILRGEFPSDENWAKETLQKIYKELTQPLIREAKQAMEAGMIKKLDPTLVAYHIIGVMDQMMFQYMLDSEYDYETIWKNIHEVLTSGLTLQKSEGSTIA